MTQKVITREENVYENEGGLPQREVRVVQEKVSTRRSSSQQAVLKASQFFWLILGMLEALLGMRVFLKIIAANPQSGFARLVYGVSDVFLLPFFGLTQTPSANGSVLEISTLIAMVVYAILFAFIVYIVRLIGER